MLYLETKNERERDDLWMRCPNSVCWVGGLGKKSLWKIDRKEIKHLGPRQVDRLRIARHLPEVWQYVIVKGKCGMFMRLLFSLKRSLYAE